MKFGALTRRFPYHTRQFTTARPLTERFELGVFGRSEIVTIFFTRSPLFSAQSSTGKKVPERFEHFERSLSSWAWDPPAARHLIIRGASTTLSRPSRRRQRYISRNSDP
jgi:hypothetical protein